ncbi:MULTISPECIES: hypothetical protein [Pseudomonas]|uniref:Uncharacterized protein n=1 Tax=Pseudomonas donghuensis TaxID=1163398 RepID=A0AAP0SB54_9PSED|nr:MULTISPECIES: hypothetical protein [Pseudomonas]MDF9895265.1 gamma-glutamyltranspeptidase [Pseudomonas vranovensis]KDN97451.1 hypothetical protein BV82_4684 [Pseudomonas donghuensis]MBF4206925.1 hypothetical protein [Pseudomonas donghuensis]MBS7597724.1 hypothetical protein [Pseudomonas sp. RC2C2]MCP6690791.1 hypothetical protein [Pseudomonas donghuensis]
MVINAKDYEKLQPVFAPYIGKTFSKQLAKQISETAGGGEVTEIRPGVIGYTGQSPYLLILDGDDTIISVIFTGWSGFGRGWK